MNNTTKTSVSETIQRLPLIEAQNVVENKKKYGQEQCSIWRSFAIVNFSRYV